MHKKIKFIQNHNYPPNERSRNNCTSQNVSPRLGLVRLPLAPKQDKDKDKEQKESSANHPSVSPCPPK